MNFKKIVEMSFKVLMYYMKVVEPNVSKDQKYLIDKNLINICPR